MQKPVLTLTLTLFISFLIGQVSYSPKVLAQIKQVENHLAGEVKITGEKEYNIIDRMAHYKVKGLSIAVIEDYKIAWAKGYGWADEKERRPVTANTMFEPGSISKSLNAMGLLKLVQEHKLDLNTDINTYLKSWTFPYDSISKGKKITLANLLSHTAGLTVHGFPGYSRTEKIPSVPEILDGKKPANTPAVRSAFEPGLRFQYSGGGTTISQLILTDYTQRPYDQFMAEQVFKPLDMTNSSYTQPPLDNKLKQVATGYRADGSMVETKFHVYPEQGAAGLWTTPTDICKYIIETQLAYEGKSAKLLNQDMTKLRLSPYLDASSALGVFIEERGGIKYFQHGAANEGFRGIYFGSLEGGYGLAIFVNSDNGNIMGELINSVATVYNWKDFYKPILQKRVPVTDAVLQQYPGIYIQDNNFAIVLKKKDGLYLASNGNSMKMHFSSDIDFFNLESLVLKQFTKDADGNIIGYTRTRKGESLPQMVKVKDVKAVTGSSELFNSIGWNLIEHKEYNEAISYLNRGLELYPANLIMEGNLAHGLLFLNKYDEAIKIYRQHLTKTIDGAFTWENMIKQDFDFFKMKKFDTRLMDRVKADLKLK